MDPIHLDRLSASLSKASGSGKLTRFDRDHVEGYDAIGDDYERLPSAPSVF